jgi:hypothetical protein
LPGRVNPVLPSRTTGPLWIIIGLLTRGAPSASSSRRVNKLAKLREFRAISDPLEEPVGGHQDLATGGHEGATAAIMGG